MELFILGNTNEYSKKLFNSWEVLQAYITCTFLYGNTFVLGVDVGNVRFYFFLFVLDTFCFLSGLFLSHFIVENVRYKELPAQRNCREASDYWYWCKRNQSGKKVLRHFECEYSRNNRILNTEISIEFVICWAVISHCFPLFFCFMRLIQCNWNSSLLLCSRDSVFKCSMFYILYTFNM